jgi:hypothetical protein
MDSNSRVPHCSMIFRSKRLQALDIGYNVINRVLAVCNVTTYLIQRPFNVQIDGIRCDVNIDRFFLTQNTSCDYCHRCQWYYR